MEKEGAVELIICPYCEGKKEREEYCKCCNNVGMQPCDYCGATGKMDPRDAYEQENE